MQNNEEKGGYDDCDEIKDDEDGMKTKEDHL